MELLNFVFDDIRRRERCGAPLALLQHCEVIKQQISRVLSLCDVTNGTDNKVSNNTTNCLHGTLIFSSPLKHMENPAVKIQFKQNAKPIIILLEAENRGLNEME